MWQSLFPQEINHTFNIASLVSQAIPLRCHSADCFQYRRGLVCDSLDPSLNPRGRVWRI